MFSGFGNIALAPKFVSTDSLRLEEDSPCIDTGDNLVDFEPFTAGLQLPPDKDLGDNPRITDGDGDGVARIDMGAYEFQPGGG